MSFNYLKANVKKGFLWGLAIFIVVVLPLSIFFIQKYLEQDTINSDILVADYQVPTITEQPKDTLVTDKIIPIHKWQTKEGMQVVFVPTEKLPIIDIDVSFSAGSARDGNLFGLASMTADLLDQGTKSKPDAASEIAEIFDRSGAIFNASVDRDRASIYLRTLASSKNLDEIIGLYSEVIAKPSFDISGIEREKEQLIVTLNYNAYIPDEIGKNAFFKTMYNDHPYGHPVIGTLDTVNKITQEDIKTFHAKYYVANNGVITIVGGIHRDKAKEIASKISSKLEIGRKANCIPEVVRLKKFVEKFIHHPANQSFILLGQPCMAYNDKAYYAFLVGNQILGGPFTSRLFREVRISKGLTYDIKSKLLLGVKEGPFVTSLHTRNSLVEKSLPLIKEIIGQFIKEGPTKKELRKAKKHIIGGFPLSFQKNSLILSELSALSFYNMPLDFYDDYIKKIEALTVEDIKRVFGEKLNVDEMVQIVVGDVKNKNAKK